jgi:xanthine dehydrogenase YagR molybdenum-binding subunit
MTTPTDQTQRPPQRAASETLTPPFAPPLTTEPPLQALGEGRERLEGRLKVQGQAHYAAEFKPDDMLFGVVVNATVPHGRITAIQTDEAKQSPGVVAVYTHLDGLKINPGTPFSGGGSAAATYVPLQSDVVRWNGQHIALVVAETLEQATEGATRVKVEYAPEPALINPQDPQARPEPVEALDVEWGDAHRAMADAPVRVHGVYTTPREYNSPIELHGCIAQWQDELLTVWEPSQWVGGARHNIAEWFGLGIDQVRVISPYVGGGFGSKGAPHGHVALACLATRALGRPVKVVLTRPQTFTGYGGRPRTRQAISLGATPEGRLLSIVHDSWNETSMEDTHQEPCNSVTPLMYGTENFFSRHRLVRVHTVNPGWMRAPGENPSTYALEIAMDELAEALELDPLELRRRNWTEQDQAEKVPWTSRRLREAYTAAAEAFGWAQRNPEPRSMRRGRELIGWGMASGTYPVHTTPGEARVIIDRQGQIEVQSSGADIGTGTYTILAQTAAEVLGVPSSDIRVSLGDTALPRAPVAGGSQLANLLTAAVHKTAGAAREMLLGLAVTEPDSPLFGASRDTAILAGGEVRANGQSIAFADLLKLADRDQLVVHQDTFKPDANEKDRDNADQTASMMESTKGAHSWCAHFVEVAVDEDFGTVRVKRVVSAFDCGRLYNPTLAKSQWLGGIVMGIGQALLEEGMIDARDGRILNANLADYLMAVNADIPEIQVIDVGEPDYQASTLGGKTVGEVGIVGVAAAVSNAVYHATGKRIRELPITLDKLI